VLSTKENVFNPFPVKNLQASSEGSGYSDDLPKPVASVERRKVAIDEEKSRRLLELNKVSIEQPSKSVERPLRRDSDADSLLFYPNN